MRGDDLAAARGGAEEVDLEKVASLTGMGFPEMRAREILVRCGGGLERAIDELIAFGWDAGQEHVGMSAVDEQEKVQVAASPEQGSGDRPGVRGLANLGNTCYLNSILQALSNTISLRKYFTTGNFNADKQLTAEFAKLLQAIWADEYRSHPAANLKDIISDKYPHFAGNEQHDAHELLLHLLGGLHDNDLRKPGNVQTSSSIIDDVFGFQVRSIVEFPELYKESQTVESTRCLSLPVPRPTPVQRNEMSHGRSAEEDARGAKVQLEECLEAFSRREDLAQRDWVWCDSTCRYERSLKSLRIETVPECLTVHLNRFETTRSSGSGSQQGRPSVEKIETFVEAPIELCFPQHAAKYHLYAVVNHYGTLRGGHYTCCARVGDAASRQWHCFNDGVVSRAHESEVVTEAAYLLLYDRV